METEDYEKAALKLLSALAQANGWSREDLDNHLGFAKGYTSRLLTGNTRLLYAHVLMILGALGVEPLYFFAALHPRTSITPRELKTTLEDLTHLAAAESPLVPPPLADRVQRAVERWLDDRGLPPRGPGSRLPRKPPASR